MNRIATSYETWLFRGLIAIVALAPLPLGSNRPLPVALIALATGTLLLLWAVCVATVGVSKTNGDLGRRLAGPVMLYLLVALWILVQWLPAPFASWGNPIWAEASAALRHDFTPRITANPGATLAALSNLLAYAAVFWLALQLTSDSNRARQARNVIIGMGGAYALYGLSAYFGGTGWIDGRLPQPHRDSLSSTFVNRNSFATFAGLTLLCTATVYFERIRHILSIARPARQKASLLVETMLLHSRWITAAMLIIAITLLLTASRGGIIATLVALVALVALQLKRGAGRMRHRGIIVMLFLVVVGVALVISGNGFIERIDQRGLSIESDLRQTIFTTTIEAIRSTPWAGTGYGTYPDVIETYRVNDPKLFTVWEKAHNTWLENALELGIPAAAALNLAILWLALIAFRGVRERRQNRAYPAFGVAASLLVALHALVDFSLQIPAIAVLYAFIMGLAVAQSVPRRDRKEPASITKMIAPSSAPGAAR
jgi:O-antigen ligase